MNKQNPQCKPYSEIESPVRIVSEPEVEYQVATSLSVDNDFDKEWANGLAPDEFLQDMYAFIDSLPWNER